MKVEEFFRQAYITQDPVWFMYHIFPPQWQSVAARIAETGVEMSKEGTAWAARLSPIPMTIRKGKTNLETYVKSCIFRAHDCIHQLWGLPLPSEYFTDDDFYLYKCANMCGEVAVLTITEFFLVQSLAERFPQLKPFLDTRNALPLMETEFQGKSWQQVATRLDLLLHKKLRPRWARGNTHAMAFADDYVPMLEEDRAVADYRWGLMKENKWRPTEAPNCRYSSNLDGLELTLWMIDDFLHLMDTDYQIDRSLAEFNQERRRKIVFPEGWK